MEPPFDDDMRAFAEAERGARPFLAWRDPGGAQQIRVLDGRDLTIGRSSSNDICLEADGEASRVHAKLESVAGHWTLIDDGMSKNGTFVNGDRVTRRRRLDDGDTVRMGQTTIRFRDPSGPHTAATQTGTSAPLSESLTDTQRRILTALCAPYMTGSPYAAPATNAEIAAAVFLGVDSVKGHMRQLFRQFGIVDLPQNSKRARLAEMAMRQGLIDDHGPPPPRR